MGAQHQNLIEQEQKSLQKQSQENIGDDLSKHEESIIKEHENERTGEPDSDDDDD